MAQQASENLAEEESELEENSEIETDQDLSGEGEKLLNYDFENLPKNIKEHAESIKELPELSDAVMSSLVDNLPKNVPECVKEKLDALPHKIKQLVDRIVKNHPDTLDSVAEDLNDFFNIYNSNRELLSKKDTHAQDDENLPSKAKALSSIQNSDIQVSLAFVSRDMAKLPSKVRELINEICESDCVKSAP